MVNDKPGWHKVDEVKATLKMENQYIAVLPFPLQLVQKKQLNTIWQSLPHLVKLYPHYLGFFNVDRSIHPFIDFQKKSNFQIG